MSLDDSYVVRIFRRGPRSGEARRSYDHQSLTGIVENPGTGHRQTFHGIEELWAALAKGSSRAAAGGKRKPPPAGK